MSPLRLDARSSEHGTINKTKTQAFKKIAKYIEKGLYTTGL